MFAIIRAQKIHTTQGIGGLESHLKRQYQEENVDPTRSHLNTHKLYNENSGSIVESLKSRLEDLKITPRKNAVLAIEYVITASPEFFREIEEKNKNSLFKDNYTDRERYFRDALDFIQQRHKGFSNVLSSTIHLDEMNPHIHVVVVPIDDKNKLNARHFLGGRDKLRELQDDFYKSITNQNRGLFKDLQRGKKKEKGAIDEYTQRTSPKIADIKRSIEETKISIGSEEKELTERLNYLREQKLKLNQLLEINIKTDLHKPTEKTIQSSKLKVEDSLKEVKNRGIRR